MLSIVIALIDGLFVYINNRASTEAFMAGLDLEGQRLRSGYNLLMDRTLSNMLTIATFIASDTNVQDLFLAGKKAVMAEGGGPGGPEAAAVRERLHEFVGPSWRQVQDQFSARQLHFHLGPGDTSFLRVHRPDRFGDDLTDVRFTIVDTNAERTPRVGFETGRVYSGLRGVVPVSARDPDSGETVHVGALEVGNAFESILEILDRRFDEGVGVLLTLGHVEATMWPDFVASHFDDRFEACGCVIEAASREGLAGLLQAGLGSGELFSTQRALIVEKDNKPYAVSHFPLRDYLGERDPGRPNVGAVVFWRDASNEVAAHNRNIRFNIIYGIAGFLLIEVLLFVAFRYALVHLEREVRSKTSELENKNEELARLSATDALTGLFNRLKLDDAFALEIRRAERYSHPLSVVLVDIDHFKAVNDNHGHLVGDEVLTRFANLLRRYVREIDIAGRWGGEEFMVICPETDIVGAVTLAEHLRAEIGGYPFPAVGNMTASFGVAELLPGEDEDRLVARADAALYRAKQNGRNRVETPPM